ncbi:MAG: membrane protein insertase YidC [Acidobacteria bacterium]|nr:membrane protein insertase YidC [Acidobacteriota bacterium]
MDNRRLLLAVFLSWMLVVVWGLVFGKKQPEPQAPTSPATIGEEMVDSPASVELSEGSASRPGGEEAVEVTEAELLEQESVEATEESSVPVETPSYTAELSNRGGVLTSLLLKDQFDSAGNPLDLVRKRQGGPWPFALVSPTGAPLEVNQALFQVRDGELPDGRREVAFEYRGRLGSATKRYTFDASGRVDLAVSYSGGPEWSLLIGPGVSNPSEEKIAQAQFWRGAVYREATEKVRRIDARKAKATQELAAGELRWIALDDQYFMSAVFPRSGFSTVSVVPYWFEGTEGQTGTPAPLPPFDELSKEERSLPRSLGLLLNARSETVALESYWGAKIYDRLAQQSFGLEESINYGWFSFLARPLQWALNQIHAHVVPNYGWAIILMTIAIKLLLLPLTHKSMTSAQKMQVLNPKVQAIRTRYRSKLKDAKGRPNLEMQRKMQDEIMALYKAEGVNPAGGCLPVVVQIPVFFAFYQLLRAAIELRNAPWIGWIQDLSSMDPHYVLPLVMFGTQFIQQLRMPMGTDPMQRRLFLLMPFMFLFIFLKFPSGLVLYWLTNNVFSILQQEVYLRRRKRAEAGELSLSTPKKKRSEKS